MEAQSGELLITPQAMDEMERHANRLASGSAIMPLSGAIER